MIDSDETEIHECAKFCLKDFHRAVLLKDRVYYVARKLFGDKYYQIEFYDDIVEVSWKEYSHYGEYDEYCEHLPLKLFLGTVEETDEAIVLYQKEQQDKKRKLLEEKIKERLREELLKEASEQKKELELYKELKQKYEQKSDDRVDYYDPSRMNEYLKKELDKLQNN